MAENDYNFDNFLVYANESSNSENEQQKNNKSTSKGRQVREEDKKNKKAPTEKASSVRIKARSGRTTPFAVQLHERDQEIIRAVCDAEGITQKRFFEYMIDGFLEGKGKRARVRTAIENYRAKAQKYENSLLD
jgi:hypothetical protein